MIKIKRQVLGLMAAAGLALITAPVPMAQASEGGTLNVAHVTFTMDWSPLRGGGAHFRWNSLWNASPMYIDAEGELHPYVFTSWQANEDSTEWTFEIDPDAAFSDGSPITAADVKGSWELSARPGTRNQRIPQVLSGVEGYAEVSGGDASELTGVTAGDGTVTVRLTDPDPIFFQKVANQIAPIVKVGVARNEAGDEVEEWWHVDNGVVVSGPFIPTEMDLDAGRVVFEPNPNFFGPAPMLDRIVLRTVEDPVTATSLLQSGEMDAHTSLNTPTRIQDLGAEFASGPMIPKGHHFWFNSFREPMNDPLVREALVRAVDPAGLIAVTYPDGPNQLANQILNAVNGVDEDWPGYSFDPEAARAALADSSYGGPEG
ncbi:MAG: ABC transporter substrate-binding protein, partial [Hyphomicrobiales bacterium]